MKVCEAVKTVRKWQNTIEYKPEDHANDSENLYLDVKAGSTFFMSKNISYLSARRGLEDNLFQRYGELVDDQGIISTQDLEKLAEDFLVGTASLYGTTTFYDFLKPENQGKKIYICNGSACLCAGTQSSLKSTVLKHFAASEIGEMCCLGRCHENSAFHYQGKNYSGDAFSEIDEIMLNRKPKPDQYVVEALGEPVLTQSTSDIDGIVSDFQKILERPSLDVLDEIKKSGLRGRGGAGFPMGMKLEFCRNMVDDVKFIICNADEGDPGAFSDRYLLEKRPYSVLMGMLIAAYASGARYGVIYIRGEYPESVEAIEMALKGLRKSSLTGKNILNSDFEFHFKVIKAQGSYICGEETALINSIEGQRPEVRTRPPYPAQFGLFGKPTTVSNVETLASLPYILKYGGEVYNKIGTAQSSGTKLLSLDSHFKRAGIYEVDMGTPLMQVIEAAGGFKTGIKALHIGGPLGGLVPLSKIPDLCIDFESFRQHGFLLGHASVIAIPESMPMINYLGHLFEFAAHESCGKCFPCRLGTKRGEELIKKSIMEGYKIDMTLFDDLLHTLEQGSLCAHGGGIPLPVRNALQYFSDEMTTNFSANSNAS